VAGPPEVGRGRWPGLAAGALAAAIAAAYLVVDLPTGDLAAHLYRAELFDREGLSLWNAQWYGGHHLPAYSVLFPPLAGLLGPRLLAGLSVLAAAILFELLVSREFGDRARWAALWLAASAGAMLFTGRLAFLFGAAIGLGALLALQRGRPLLACAVAVLCSLASPVAGLFLAMAGVAYALAGLVRGGDRATAPPGAALAVAALAPAAALAWAFPEGGYQPFTVWPFVAIPVVCAVVVVALPPERWTLRIGAALYGVGAVLAFVLHTPVGSNAVRLLELAAGPLVAAVLLGGAVAGARARALAAVLVACAYFSFYPAVRDIAQGLGDPAYERAYYEPLLGFLAARGGEPGRVEIPFTRSHFEAVEVAPRWPLARGWERQLDVERNSLFYEGTLTHAEYRRWLRDKAVRFVAVPDTTPDPSAEEELELIADPRSGVYLRPVWSSRSWDVYAVRPPTRMLVPEHGALMSLEELGPDSATVSVRRPGTALLRVAWSPYWRVEGGCVERAGEWTRIVAPSPGPLELRMSFSADRLFSHGRRCS
jgi:hypothetical protein